MGKTTLDGEGNTRLPSGERVAKDDARLEVVGALEELSATIGVAASHPLPAALADVLRRLQERIHDLIGAVLAPPRDGGLPVGAVTELEEEREGAEGPLPLLDRPVLPAGGPAAASLHLARALCRRAERRLVTLARSQRIPGRHLRFLDAAADLLFVLARRANAEEGIADLPLRAPDERE